MIGNGSSGSLIGQLHREHIRERLSNLADHNVRQLAYGRDTDSRRDRAERLSRRAAAFGHPDDQFRLAGVLFNRIAVENMDIEARARRSGEALLLLDGLIERGYGPASELRHYVLAHLPALVVWPALNDAGRAIN